MARKKLIAEFEITIDDFAHDGRGVGRREGKAVFVSGALPGERVLAKQTGRNRHFDEAQMLQVLEASPDRVPARCPHFGTCAGCVLQHLAEDQQIAAKQRVLTENLQRIGHVQPETVLAPLTDAAWGYRRKGRFSVRWVEKKGKALVGFRELDPRFVADLNECHTVIPAIGARIPELSALVESLDGRRTIPQIEFIAGDGPVALVFRHLEALSAGDREKLIAFAQHSGFAVFLQPGGI
ncbi:MAG TPA: TRAM domain-containing protein, partial [Arenimonas sp.]|nr:TRAM domain-containing protein [Arenimonas sp.]